MLILIAFCLLLQAVIFTLTVRSGTNKLALANAEVQLVNAKIEHFGSLNEKFFEKISLEFNGFELKYIENNELFISPGCSYDHVVSRSFIASIVDNNRISDVKREKDYLRHLRMDIYENGFKEPLEILYDENGFVRLQEGHHRFLASPYNLFPVVARKVNKANSRFNVKNVDALLGAIDLGKDK